jgi:hypothetical protein
MNPTFIRNNPILVSIILFLTIYGVFQILKPSFLYKKDGSLMNFGVGYRDKTILPVWLLSIILGILSYLFVRYYISRPIGH